MVDQVAQAPKLYALLIGIDCYMPNRYLMAVATQTWEDVYGILIMWKPFLMRCGMFQKLRF